MLKTRIHMVRSTKNINLTSHPIDLIPENRHFKYAPYRAGPKTTELKQLEIGKQFAAGVIEPAQSVWTSPVLFVPKKDHSLQFFIKYQKRNEVRVKDSYHILRMDGCIDSVGGTKIISTFGCLLRILANPNQTRRPK